MKENLFENVVMIGGELNKLCIVMYEELCDRLYKRIEMFCVKCYVD